MAEVPVRMALPAPRAEQMSLLVARLSALVVAAMETGVGIWIEVGRQGATGRAIHHGTPGLLLRAAALLTGPVPLVARILGWVPIAAVCFLIGAVSSRYGWVFAGRFSARDPEETIATQNAESARHFGHGSGST